MIKGDISRSKRKKKVDGIASQVILQSYLDRKDMRKWKTKTKIVLQ